MSERAPESALTARVRWTVALLVALAVLLRVVYVLQQAKANPFFAEPLMDALYHAQWAQALAAGEDFQPGPFFRAPLYPWFLGTVLRFFGDGLLLPRLLQCGFGGATTWLTFLVARRAFGNRAALLAALLVALNWVLVYFDGELLIPTLAIPLNLLALWLSLDLAEQPTPRRIGLAGMAWGVAAIARPNGLLFVPLLLGWLVLRQRPAWKRGLWQGAILIAAVLVPIAPLTFYNVVVGGDTVLISSQAGVNLWIGNNPQSDGSTAIVPGTRPGWWEGYHDAIALAEREEGRKLLPSEVSAHYSGKAWSFLLGEPGVSLPHLWWKLRLFFSDWELGNNQDVHFFAHRFSDVPGLLPPSFGLLLPLGVVGLLLSWPTRRRTFPLLGFLATYSASVVLFFVCSRYRAPVLPLLAVYSGHALVLGFDAARARRFLPLGVGAAVAGLLAVAVQQVPKAVDTTDASGLMQLGLSEVNRGRPEAAIGPLRESVERNPRKWISRQYLGYALHRTGRVLEARTVYQGALAMVPGSLELTSYYVEACLATGEAAEAERAARDAIARNPGLAAPWDDLAAVHLFRSELDRARQALERGLAIDPRDFRCNLRLGLLHLGSGDPRAAISHLSIAATHPMPLSQALQKQAAEALRRARAEER